MARRPWPGEPARTMVPVSAIATAAPVITPSKASRSSADSPSSVTVSMPGGSAGRSRPGGTTTRRAHRAGEPGGCRAPDRGTVIDQAVLEQVDQPRAVEVTPFPVSGDLFLAG